MIEIETPSSVDIPSNIKRSLSKTAARLRALGEQDFVNKQLESPSTYLIRSPGKYVRPLLVFVGATALGKDPGRYVDLAASIELLHTASLVHDDIIDGDTIRRGKSSVHIAYGVDSAILAGDALIAKSILLASPYGSEVISAISEAAMEMCAGEMLDYECQSKREVPSKKRYIEIARLKSASLIGTAASIVAVHERSGDIDALREFGVKVGTAFQIRDDVLNFAGMNDSRPKSTGNDASGFRPNIVSVLQAASAGPDDALARALELNNSLIDEACSGLEASASAKQFKRYADMIRVRAKGASPRRSNDALNYSAHA